MLVLDKDDTLVKKWAPVLEGLEGYTKKVTAILLENQAKAVIAEKRKIDEDLSSGATTVGNLGTFQKFSFPLVRRVFPNLISNSVVAVQPMEGPVSQIFYLGGSRQYGSTRQDIYSKYNLTYRNLVTSTIGGSGLSISTGSLVLSSLLGYSKGSPSTTFGGQIAMWPDTTTILGYNVSAGEYLTGTGIPEVNFHIEQQPVVSRTRKMRTLWTIEANQDLKAYHNLDLESELTELLTNEIKLEVDREVLEDLRLIAYDPNVAGRLGGWFRDALDNANSNNFGPIGGHDGFRPANFQWNFTGAPTNPSGTQSNVWILDLSSLGGAAPISFAPQHLGHLYANVLAVLNLASQDIFKTTHRGPGSWIITSPLVGAMLESAAKLEGGLPANMGPTNMGANQIAFKGKFAGKYDLFIDPLWPEDEILMGYKGSSPMDAGYVYCPYIPFEMLPNVTDPETFQPRKGIMTRYGKAAVTPESRFYRVIRFVGTTTNYLLTPFGKNSTNTPAF